MNKTAQIEFQRIFLINSLPDPLTPAGGHLQVFDNYIEGTRLRLRMMRDPSTKSWTKILQQRIDLELKGQTATKRSEIHLNDEEYGVFERFRGREVRMNRYFHEFDQVEWKFDIYLGEARGLMTAKIDLASPERSLELVTPSFARLEITGEPFFAGENLVDKNRSEIFAEIERVAKRADQ